MNYYYHRRKFSLTCALISYNDLIMPLRHKAEPKLSYYELDEIFDLRTIKRYGLLKALRKLLSK